MKDYLKYLQELSEKLFEEVNHFELKLKNANCSDKDKLTKLNTILANLKKLSSLLNKNIGETLPEIHQLIVETLQASSEKKISSAIKKLQQKPLFEFLLKYNQKVVDLRNQIIQHEEAMNAILVFGLSNDQLEKDINAIELITSEWASDSSNLLFASDEEYVNQLKTINATRNTLKGVTEKANKRLKETLKRKENADSLLSLTLDISRLKQLINENSDLIAPVKGEFQKITHYSPDLVPAYKEETRSSLSHAKDIISDAENKYSIFRDEALLAIDQLRLKKLAWELKNRQLNDEVSNAFKNLSNALTSLDTIRLNIEAHVNRMASIVGFNEGRSIFNNPHPDIQPMVDLETLETMYFKNIQQIETERDRLRVLLNNHVSANDFHLSNEFIAHLKNTSTFSLNYPTQHKTHLTDEEHDHRIQAHYENLQTISTLIIDTKEIIERNLRLTKFQQSEILIRHKSSYAAINDKLFKQIKLTVVESEDFTALACHQLAAMNKATLINTYLDSIKNSTNLEELIKAVDENPKDDSGLTLRQNTGLSKKLGVRLGGAVYGLFHHGYKSTCDEYASKLKALTNNTINARIEEFKKPT